MLKSLLFGGANFRSIAANLGLALLRIFTGTALAFGHGIGKMPPSDKFIEGTAKLGFPIPTLFAWAAGLSEFAGGILLALGLFTRVSSAFIAFTMFVAAFVRHINDGFETQEKALMYLFIALLFVGTGSGQLGVDAMIRDKKGGKD
jgi:putative oxidoreductase